MSGALTPEERSKLDALFERAAELPQSEHASFVEHECGSSVALGVALARLLAGLAGDDILAQARQAAPSRVGTRIGPYKLLEKVGEGGMGEVYAADQLEPVVRRVALKVIKAGMDSAQVVARFEAERQALARMSHPYVAQVFDGGTTDEGRPYFVMEYVAGDPITEYCDRRKLSTRARVELFLSVCAGVQHAHQKGIVHRDLKPSNLMVTEQEGRALPKVIDFGVARAMTGRLAERTLHTMQGQVIGTLDYMSPEQADPSGVDIDTRSDIYSLGVVLYQLVSGLLPFEYTSNVDTPFSEVQRAIREDDAPTPSTRLRQKTNSATTIAPLHGTDERSLVRQLHGDLDWICLKALEKDPARRYASASELAADLRRHLAYEPVLAGRPGALYRVGKFVRRNRVGVTASALVTAALFVGVAGFVNGRVEAAASERLARVALDASAIAGLEFEADELWPPFPEMVEDMDYWLSRAGDVVARLPQYREMLVEVEGSGDLVARPRQHAAIVSAIEGGEQLRDGLFAQDSITAEHSWSVPKRRAFAQKMAAGFASGGEYESAWDKARDEITLAQADLDGDGDKEDAYPFLDLEPQLGLLPLGADKESGLLEFAHLMTGEPAVRGADEKLVLTADTGLVLVLIPEGALQIRRVNGTLLPAEDGGGEIPLSAYFISKFEMTQGQWLRLTGRNPSAYRPGVEGLEKWSLSDDSGLLLHPVEQVSWLDCDRWLCRAGLTLPSEAQWERGARGGAKTRFWTGDDLDSLQGAANVRDVEFVRAKLERWDFSDIEFDDGSAAHWAVGSGRANNFGLHDVHGNVVEWCLDGYEFQLGGLRPDGSPVRDPVAAGSSDLRHVYRGGCFRLERIAASFSDRSFDPPSFSGSGRGVRPARALSSH